MNIRDSWMNNGLPSTLFGVGKIPEISRPEQKLAIVERCTEFFSLIYLCRSWHILVQTCCDSHSHSKFYCRHQPWMGRHLSTHCTHNNGNSLDDTICPLLAGSWHRWKIENAFQCSIWIITMKILYHFHDEMSANGAFFSRLLESRILSDLNEKCVIHRFA